MKKIILVVLVASLLLYCFSGCGGTNNNGNIDSTDTNPGYVANIDMTDEDYQQTNTLTIGVTADTYETDLIKALGEGFNQLFPNVTIEPVRISGTDYSSAVVGRKNAGNMPDIFYTSETESFRFISSKLYLNLDPYIEAEEKAFSPNKGSEYNTWIDQFVGEAMKLGQKNYNGAQYFIPRSSDRIVTHLNMKYIKAALNWEGRSDKSVTIDTVKNGWTWEEFVKVCKVLREYYDTPGLPDPDDSSKLKSAWTTGDGRYILDSSFTWAPVTFALFKSNEARFYENGDWTINSEETKKTIAMIRELIDLGIIAPTNGGAANYENGSGAMLFHSSSAITKYKNYIGNDYDIVTFPIINGDKGVTGYGVPGYGIYSGISETKRDLAWQFLAFMLSVDGQNLLAKAGMRTPSVRMDLQDYNTAAWGEGYTDLNLAATTFQTSRNYSETFFLNFDATTKNGILSACAQFIDNIQTYGNSGQPNFTAEKCIATVETALKKAVNVK